MNPISPISNNQVITRKVRTKSQINTSNVQFKGSFISKVKNFQGLRVHFIKTKSVSPIIRALGSEKSRWEQKIKEFLPEKDTVNLKIRPSKIPGLIHTKMQYKPNSEELKKEFRSSSKKIIRFLDNKTIEKFDKWLEKIIKNPNVKRIRREEDLQKSKDPSTSSASLKEKPAGHSHQLKNPQKPETPSIREEETTLFRLKEEKPSKNSGEKQERESLDHPRSSFDSGVNLEPLESISKNPESPIRKGIKPLFTFENLIRKQKIDSTAPGKCDSNRSSFYSNSSKNNSSLLEEETTGSSTTTGSSIMSSESTYKDCILREPEILSIQKGPFKNSERKSAFLDEVDLTDNLNFLEERTKEALSLASDSGRLAELSLEKPSNALNHFGIDLEKDTFIKRLGALSLENDHERMAELCLEEASNALKRFEIHMEKAKKLGKDNK